MRVAGFGFRSGSTHGALADALAKAQAIAGDAPISALATIEGKSQHPGLHALASELRLRVLPVDPASISNMQTETRSDRVAALYGTGSIAEAAALAAAGAGAKLVCARVISGDGTAVAAIAEGQTA